MCVWKMNKYCVDSENFWSFVFLILTLYMYHLYMCILAKTILMRIFGAEINPHIFTYTRVHVLYFMCFKQNYLFVYEFVCLLGKVFVIDYYILLWESNYCQYGKSSSLSLFIHFIVNCLVELILELISINMKKFK